jgi:hypothetical protein
LRRLIALAACALALGGGAARALRLPAAPRCPVFPASNPGNQRVDTLPGAQDSNAIIRSIGVDTGLHPDFGSGLYDGVPIGIPVTVVAGSRTPKIRPRFEYADESEPGPYPIPRNVRIEGGSDRHAIIVDRESCRPATTRAI